MAVSIFCCMPSIYFKSMHSSATFADAYTIPIPRTSSVGQSPDQLPSFRFKYDHNLSQDIEKPSSTCIDNNNSEKTIASRLENVWKEIQGLNNWENLVQPHLDPLLQHEIIRYGEFVTACYKAFDLNPTSKRFLNCKYGKKSMLREVGLGDSGYEVTKYIYATAPDLINLSRIHCCGRWIGYVAVSSEEEVRRRLGRRDIVITFRGTVTNPEWIANLMSSLTPAKLDPNDPRPDVKVETGFLSLYTSNESGSRFGLGSCREQLLSEIFRLLKKYKDEEISITLAGHSMGSSLAVLLAYDMAELGLKRCWINSNNNINSSNGIDQEENTIIIPVTVFSFGGPRVGNMGFKKRCEELGVKVLRVVNVNDPITKLPGIFLNENYNYFNKFFKGSCYAHVGVELLVDFFKLHNPHCVHDLESYLGLLRSRKSNSGTTTSWHKDEYYFGVFDNNLVKMAKGFLSSGAQRFGTFKWRNAAMKLIRSQRT